MISGQGKVILIWFIFPVQRTAPTAQSGRRSENQIVTVETKVKAGETALEKARIAHDWLVDTITYAYDANGDPDNSMTSHSITGVFDAQYHTAVCEGYAKSFQLLMNAAGVSNFYIVGLGNGGGHAWNMAQMDDGYYYYFDATWDDTAQTSKYFAAGETSLSQNHSPYVYDKSSWEFLYDLPDVPDADYDLQPGPAVRQVCSADRIHRRF